MLKISYKSAWALLATSINNSKFVNNSNRNNRKSAKSDFIELVYKAKEPNFLTPGTRRAFI